MLEVKNLEKRYGAIRAVRGVSLHVNRTDALIMSRSDILRPKPTPEEDRADAAHPQDAAAPTTEQDIQ